MVVKGTGGCGRLTRLIPPACGMSALLGRSTTTMRTTVPAFPPIVCIASLK